MSLHFNRHLEEAIPKTNFSYFSSLDAVSSFFFPSYDSPYLHAHKVRSSKTFFDIFARYHVNLCDSAHSKSSKGHRLLLHSSQSIALAVAAMVATAVLMRIDCGPAKAMTTPATHRPNSICMHQGQWRSFQIRGLIRGFWAFLQDFMLYLGRRKFE